MVGMNTKQKFQDGDAITWLQVHNLLPIIVGIVSVVTAFSILQTKVELNKQATDDLKVGVQSCTTREDTSGQALHNLELKVADLEARQQSVKGISTKATPTDTPTPTKK